MDTNDVDFPGKSWIACNICCRTAIAYYQFYFGKCGHIYCRKCVENFLEGTG